jgi:2-phosphoglycolate phosphatase
VSPRPDLARVRGIVFDLDGTLIDSYEAIAESLNHALASAGMAPLPAATIRGMVGLGLESLIARAMGEERVAEGVRAFRAHYDGICVAKTSLLPEVRETLEALHGRGYRMAVATNKPSYFAWRLLESLRVRRYLAAVLGPDVVQNRKPHPEMVLKAIERMGLSPAESVCVGDMEVDVETARAAGVPVVVLPTGSRSAEDLGRASPDLLLASFRDLLDVLPGAPAASPREDRPA